MPIEAPRRMIRWIHCPLQGELILTLASHGETWWSHWTRAGSKRCIGSGCKYCAGKDEPEPRYVYAAVDNLGSCFIEFGSAQYDKVRYIESIGAVGVVVSLRRERPRRNGLVLLEVVAAEEKVTEQDISGFVASLGS